MKTKIQILTAFVISAAVSSAAVAGNESHTAAIIGNESPIGVNVTGSNNGIMAKGITYGNTAVAIADHVSGTESTLNYHHSGGSGEGAFSGNNINVGVGFVSGEGALYNGAGYSRSAGPAIEASYEHAFGKFGVGLNIAYQSAKETYAYQGYSSYYQPVNYTDTYKLSLLQFMVRGAYHFSAGDKFDPYIGVGLGYCTISDSYTSTDPNVTSSKVSLTGVEFGGFGGARYWFSDHVGAWAEIQYAVASFKVGNVSGVSASVSINPCTVFNLGIAFKF